MRCDLLVRPVVLRPDRDAVAVLHLLERALDVMLRAVAAHQLGVAPRVVVGEQQGLAQQRVLEPLPGAPLEAVAQRRQAVPLTDRDGEQLAHVARRQPARDLLAGGLDTRLAAALGLAVAPAAQLPLQAAQPLAAFLDLAQQGAALGVEERLVERHQHGALEAEDRLAGAEGAHAGQAVGRQRAQPGGGHGQQVGVLRGHQRADEVERAALDPVEVFLRVVALVEDQRDVLGAVGEFAATAGEVRGEAAEGGGIGLVAGVGAVQQGQAGLGGDEQGDADDAQGLATLLGMAALGQRGALVEGVDVGEEVGGVEQDAAGVEAELALHGGDEVAFDGGNSLGLDAVHVVPEALGGELGGAEGEQAMEGGGVEPAGERGPGAGGEAAVEDGGEEVGADGRAGTALGDVAVDDAGEVEAAGEGEQGGAAAELAHDGVQWLGGRVSVLEFLSDGIGAAEVGLGNDLGLAVDALADAHVVVGVAVDDFLDEAGHGYRSYNSASKCLMSSVDRE